MKKPLFTIGALASTKLPPVTKVIKCGEPEILGDIKIKTKFWDKATTGEKTLEFRKLSKGYETGYYRFVSIESTSKELCDYCIGFPAINNKTGKAINEHNHHEVPCIRNHKKIYGIAFMKPIAFSPDIAKSYNQETSSEKYSFYYNGKFEKLDNELVTKHGFTPAFSSKIANVDKESYEFVRKNYIDKNIDFLAYEITIK